MPYPVVIPDVVIERLQRFLKPEFIEGWATRPAPLWNGRSPVQAVADGDKTWEQVLFDLEALLSYQFTQ